jgi:hypothetical protein
MRADRHRGTAVAALCLVLALAPAVPGAAQPPYRSSSHTSDAPPVPPPPPSRDAEGHPQRHHQPDTGSVVAGAAIAGVVACLIFCGRHTDKPRARADDTDDAPDRRDLLQNGPHVSDTQPLGVYAVYGFVRDGWPIVVDYDSDPESATWLTITVGDKSWTQGLESGRHFVKLQYRGGGARESTPALFTLESAVRGTRPSQPSPLIILGLGCGPRAVGSVAINDLRFAVSGRQVGGDFARFGYRTSSPFSRVAMEILRYGRETRDGRPVLTVATVAEYGLGAVPPGTFGPRVWDGRELRSGQPSHGPHRLQVRGWEVDGDESWVSAISPDAVTGP